jgi:hypothetical protein
VNLLLLWDQKSLAHPSKQREKAAQHKNLHYFSSEHFLCILISEQAALLGGFVFLGHVICLER